MKRFFLSSLLPLLSLLSHAEKYEAESGQISACEIMDDMKFSGNKAVRLSQKTACLTLHVNATKHKKYDVFVAAEGLGGEKLVKCIVNGTSATFKTNNFGEVEVGAFYLNKGENVITITPGWTWFNIDYIRVEESHNNISFKISKTPVTPNATPAAKALYSFLRKNFGKRTISGMMTGSMEKSEGKNILTHEDIEAVFKASGRRPALVGFDFMNSSGKTYDEPDSWYKSYTERVISLAKDTWRRGGIPDFTWHWRDPSRTTNEFYTNKIKFDFTTAFNEDGTWNTSSSLYKNIIKDIDLIADHFLELQKEDMACIFRPLHEPSGGWFWWGSKGAEPYKKLYQLIYHEVVNVKGVRNVIWNWNADRDLGYKWCPGMEYFDIVSTDIYNELHDYSSNYPAFDRLKKMTGGRKIIALAESGPVPDPELQKTEQAMWSWWMPWYQSWGGKFVEKTSNEQWRKCMDSPHIITLDDMPGWNTGQ